MSKINTSRRRFLKHSGAMSALGTVGSSWLLNMATMADAAAATRPGDYKALVCVFLAGGNDACNTILPRQGDTGSWDRYRAVRPELMLPDDGSNLIAAEPGSATKYQLHPQLTQIASLYNSGKIAVVANVGNLIGAPLTRSMVESITPPPLPARLRSHNDQQTAWQSGKTNVESVGWGGRHAEKFTFGTTQPDAFRSVVMGNNNIFNMGDTIRAYGMTSGGNGVVPLLPGLNKMLFGVVPQTGLDKIVRGQFTTARSNLIEQDYTSVVNRALGSEQYMSTLLKDDATGKLTPPNYQLARDLHMVARVINAHAGLSGRQVFFVTLPGFDTHGSQLKNHATRLAELDASLAFFNSALGGNSSRVTTFTASDFGRLLHANGDGTDHGWGGHQFVMGGAAQGGRIHGRIPAYTRNANNTSYVDEQIMSDGALIPEISIGSYCATLGRWFNLSETDLATIFPYAVSNTTVGGNKLNVGFMG